VTLWTNVSRSSDRPAGPALTKVGKPGRHSPTPRIQMDAARRAFSPITGSPPPIGSAWRRPSSCTLPRRCVGIEGDFVRNLEYCGR
jgi:hypothetical protein